VLFESVILGHLYPRSEISIYIQILQSDGGALCGAYRGTYVNSAQPDHVILIYSCNKRRDAGSLGRGISIKDTPVACAVSYVHKTALVRCDIGLRR